MAGSQRGLVVWVLVTVAAANADAAEFFRRGDATCSTSLTAADIVATMRGLGGEATCGNDDCDRDGVVTAADVGCAATCLFAACPVPENAPRVTTVMPESTAAVAPASVVRIAIGNADPESSKRVTIAGREAEVIEESDGELLVALPPDLPTGAADVVLISGDLAGAPTIIEVAPAVPVGPPDTFDGTLALLDELAAKLLTLDVETVYADNAAIVRGELMRWRTTLADQRAALAADPEVGPSERLQLDAALDASGAPEMVRETIAEIDAVAEPAEGGIAQATGVLAFQRGARTIKIVAGVATAAGTTLSTPAIVAIGTAVAIAGGTLLAANVSLTPLITGLTFIDADGNHRAFPTAGGSVIVTGHHFDTLSTSLDIQAGGGEFSGIGGTSMGDGVAFPLPLQTGFCGKVTFTLARTAFSFRSNPVSSRVQPEVLRLPNQEKAGHDLVGDMRGVSDCASKSAVFKGITEKSTTIDPVTPRVAIIEVPPVLPGTYAVSLNVEGLRSLAGQDVLVNVTNPIEKLVLSCPTRIEVPDDPVTEGVISAPLRYVSLCTASTSPEYVPRLMPSKFTWTSSSNRTVRVDPSTVDAQTSVEGRDVGTANITAVLESTVGPRQILATSAPVAIAVVDNANPRVAISSMTMAQVDAGATITVDLRASDNVKLSEVKLKATGDAVESGGDQEVGDCLLQKKCTASLTIKLKDKDFTNTTVAVQASAADVGLNRASSNTLTFTISKDTSCPTVSIDEPTIGSTVNAGETRTVVAIARDEGPSDTGVKMFRYSASGPALAAPVAQDLPLPMPQQAPTLRFNYTVKQPADLAMVDDKNIVISVEAFDAAMPPNSCGAQTVTVEVIGVLDRCQGGITTDNPSGYIDEPFTITVTLSGDGADEITRVTSVNPGGQFDLQPQGGGVYTVTLFYRGTGSFTLDFIAYDAQGEERCSGEIGLESLGPKPDSEGSIGAPAVALPAGGVAR